MKTVIRVGMSTCGLAAGAQASQGSRISWAKQMHGQRHSLSPQDPAPPLLAYDLFVLGHD